MMETQPCFRSIFLAGQGVRFLKEMGGGVSVIPALLQDLSRSLSGTMLGRFFVVTLSDPAKLAPKSWSWDPSASFRERAEEQL